VCRKCGHTKSQKRKDFAKTYNICSDTESATANTLFHKVKFGLKKPFFICFEMSTSTKSLSASQTAVRFGVHQRTARLFMHKVREAMKSSGDFPMTGAVNVDEYVVGGYEEGKPGRSYDSTKKKAVCAVELTDDEEVKRFYTFQIPYYSSKSLRKIFEKHVDKDARITTDKWKGYNPIAKDFDPTQILSDKGSKFKALHIMIHQVKSWIRKTYSWVSESNINRYFDEFCYRINRSQTKDTIFNNLIKRMVKSDNITQQKIICA
jgi:transposase-like protein